MKTLTRKMIKSMLMVVSAVWVVVAVWLQFIASPSDIFQNHNSEAIQNRMSNCEGSFKQRYACKEAIILQGSQSTLWSLLASMLIILGPPVAAGMIFRQWGTSLNIRSVVASLKPQRAAPSKSQTIPISRARARDLDEDPDVWLERARTELHAQHTRTHSPRPSDQSGGRK